MGFKRKYHLDRHFLSKHTDRAVKPEFSLLAVQNYYDVMSNDGESFMTSTQSIDGFLKSDNVG